MTITIVLLVELIAFVLTLARQPAVGFFWVDLAQSSLFLLWIGLGSAWVMCMARPLLARRGTVQVTLISLALLMLTTAAVSEAAWWAGQYYSDRSGGAGGGIFPSSHLPFVLRNVAISAVVSALILRYFYVSHQWKRNVQMEAVSRIQALQARIRPHFLFNSMNTIAALTRSDPDAAEQVVEDLADLFRASLAENKQLVHLREEFEMARLYERIERLRLGERLEVDWQVETLPHRALIPGLTVQPLLENAIYHGIEPLPDGGTVTINGRMEGKEIVIEVVNPVTRDSGARRHDGNKMALANVRQRLELAFHGKAALEINQDADQFFVRMRLPASEQMK
ncbi:MAG: histidine kinase [Gammaproteobacteria bacterium]|nr:histidine kinase [Gammaproteobacteria bacterium]MDH3767324.1 histidine kinase [Gammaproteobacteria bacterium]